MSGTLVSAQWVQQHFSEVIICDVVAGPNARSIYIEEHVEGALWVDLETQLSAPYEDASVLGRHPLPTPENFAHTLGTLGVSRDSMVILYDRTCGIMAAARMWWMLRAIGHQMVAVVDGGYEALKNIGLPVTSGEVAPVPTIYSTPVIQYQWPLIEMEDIAPAIATGKCLVDVRAAARYEGVEEPIDPVAGHIPGAINMPLMQVISGGQFLSTEALQSHFQYLQHKEVIVHCGSGVTACHTILALVHAGYPVPALYNGSWSQWCRNH